MKLIETGRCVLLAMAAGLPVAVIAYEAPETVAFKIDNTAAVQSNPGLPSRFTLGRSWRITFVSTYHWNGGAGATPGTISLREAGGTVYGPWSTVGRSGQGGVPNAYWDAAPNAVLPAGEYTVEDSDAATWSHNAESGNRGFVTVRGLSQWDFPEVASATVGAVLYSVDGDPRTSPVVWSPDGPAGEVETVLNVPTTGWAAGFHQVTFAARAPSSDETGPWATVFVRRIDSGPLLDRIAMAVDRDPTSAPAASVDVSPASDVAEGTLSLPAGNVGPGLHNLWMRCRGVTGEWGPLVMAPVIGEAVEPLAQNSQIVGFELRVIDSGGGLQAGPLMTDVAATAHYDGSIDWPALRTRVGGDYRLLAAAVAGNGLAGPWQEAAYRQSVTAFAEAMNAVYWPPPAFPGVDVSFGGDANADGVANGLAFFHGVAPNLPAWTRGVRVTSAAHALVVHFREKTGGSGLPGIDYTVNGVRAVLETSADLGHDWVSAAGAATLEGAPIDEGDGTETVAVRVPIPPAGRQIFVRLSLELLTGEI